MKRWRGVLRALVPVGALFLLALTCTGFIHSDTTRAVSVRGRLVDAESGTPIVSAWVMSFPRREWAEDPEWVPKYRKWIKAYRAAKARRPAQGDDAYPVGNAEQCGGGTTDEDGRFEFDVSVLWSWNTNTLGCRLGSVDPPPRHGVAVLRVEAPGRPVRIVDLEGGDWRETGNRDWRSYWAKWDLGEVRVSFDE